MHFVRPLFLLMLLILSCAGGAQKGQASAPSIIRDTEIETILQSWSKDVFKAAGMDISQIDLILVQSPEINAFVAGGSNIFIYTGLIQKTKTPEELIGVIAHETGHISGGHLIRTKRALEQSSFESMLAMVLGLGAALAGGGGDAVAAGAHIGRAMGTNNFLTHSRVQESSADQAGLKFLVDAGIDPSGLISFLEKISDQELLPTASQSAYMRTHPLSRDRIESLKYIVQTSQYRLKPRPQNWDDQHARIKAKLMGFIEPNKVTYEYPSSDQSIPARYARAIAAYRQSRIADALKSIDQLIAIEPQNAYFHELKGQILYETGSAKVSLAPYQTALRLAPHSGLIRTAYASALLDTGRLKESIIELKRAEKDEPRSSRVKRLLATASGKLGNEAEAKVYLAEEALMQNRIKDARSHAEIALKSLPQNSSLRIRAQDVISLSESRNRDVKDE